MVQQNSVQFSRLKIGWIRLAILALSRRLLQVLISRKIYYLKISETWLYSNSSCAGDAVTETLAPNYHNATGYNFVQAGSFTTQDSGPRLDLATALPTVILDAKGAIRIGIGQYLVSTLSAASAIGAGGMAYISDDTNGPITAFSDGTNLHRTTDSPF